MLSSSIDSSATSRFKALSRWERFGWARLGLAWVLSALLANVLIAPCSVAQVSAPAEPAAVKAGLFHVRFDAALQSEPYSGRVYVAIGKSDTREPRLKMGDWFAGAQVFARDVSKVGPGGDVLFGPDALAYPKSSEDFGNGEYFVQAIARRNLDSCHPGSDEGDLYSEPRKVSFEKGNARAVELVLSKSVAAKLFKETDRVKLFEIKSPSLSKFLGRDFTMKAGVILPAGWKDDASVRTPTLYWIGGFGGDHRAAFQMARMLAQTPGADKCLVVVPDPTCYWGHSVFADSATNGPWGQAFTSEMIPALEAKFHGSGTVEHRYVSGISSGGWSSLWLQVTYPETFSGVWSHCPDPVDFHDFQRIDLNAPGVSMYVDPSGERRPLARQGGQVKLWYKDFIAQESVMGPGGQIGSFEAVFSPRGADGRPVELFDRKTGLVNASTAKAWEKYDIRAVLERDWQTLGPKLAGKLHVVAGGEDTFYLEGAVKRLAQTMKTLGSDADIQVIDGMPHTVHQPTVKKMFEVITGIASESSEAPKSAE